jgi:putative transposase
LQGADRYDSFTSPQVGAHGGAALNGAMPRLSKIGRIPIRLRLHRPLQGAPKTLTINREADGWHICISCAEVPSVRSVPSVPSVPLPCSGRATGIDVGLKVFLTTADGEPTRNPRYDRKAEWAPPAEARCKASPSGIVGRSTEETAIPTRKERRRVLSLPKGRGLRTAI